jgi:tight adherence protein C
MLVFTYPIAAVVLALLTACLWHQRSAPRRATLATLRAATASTSLRAPPPARSEPRSAAPVNRRGTFEQWASHLARVARRLSPPAYAVTTARRLELAGKGRAVDEDRFLALRLVTLLSVGPAFVLVLLSPLHGLYALLAFIFITAVLGLGPEALLNNQVSARQERISRDLPAVVELLMISVEAGLGFDQALSRAVTSVPGPLGEEFSRYLGEVRMGASHHEALEALDRRTGVPELRSFVMALVQAETFGISVGSILRSQAKESRIAQHQHIQEQAQKAPLKMLFPLVFCVLPALFVVVLGPAAIEIYRELIK